MLILALFGILALVTLVAAFLGAKYWHWAHVMVVVLLFFSTVGFAVLAARVLDARSGPMKRAQDAAAQLEPQQKLNEALRAGTDDPALISQLANRPLPDSEATLRIPDDAEEIPGLVELQHDLSLASRRLGRVWRNAQPLGIQNGQVVVGIENPNPLGISADSVLYAFEQGSANTQDPEQGRQYLGEYRVVAVGGQQVTLEPTLSLDPREVNRLTGSQGPWSLYETMPGDSREMLEAFSDEQLRQLMPQQTAEEYVRDGTPWTVDDGEWTKEGLNANGEVWTPQYTNAEGEVVVTEDGAEPTRFIYRRQLRDYAYLFNEFSKRRVELLAQAQALKEDNAKLAATLASAKQLGQLRTAEQEKLKFDLAGVKRDHEAADAFLANVQRQVERAQSLLEETLATNSRLADELLALQQAAAGGDLRSTPARSRGALDIDAL